VSVLDFGADPTGATDSSIAIQAAVNAGFRVKAPIGRYLVNTTVTLRQNQFIEGDGSDKTLFTTTAAITTFKFENTLGIANAVFGPQIKGVRFIGTGSAKTGLSLAGVYLCRFEDVTFSGYTEEQLKLTQVWDSWFKDVYWKDNLAGNVKPALLLDSGTGGDNTNNLRFFGCTWEGLTYGAIKSVTSVGGGNNYAMEWFGCKFEGCNATNSAAAYIELSTLSGPHIAFGFYGCLVSFIHGPNHKFISGSYAKNFVIKGMQVSANLSYTAPFIALSGSNGVSIDDVYIYASGSTVVTYLVSNGGTNNSFNIGRVLVNDNPIQNGCNTEISTSPEYGYQQTYFNGITAQKLTRKNTAYTNGTVSVIVDTLGEIQVYSDHSGSNVLLYQCNALGLMRANGGFQVNNAAWNGSLFLIGDFRFWVDGSGRLRIKNGDPTSDTDGTVVGTQT
jgi:hypothetical protein